MSDPNLIHTRMASLGIPRHWSPGACVMVQGQPATGVFFITRGDVLVELELPGGDRVRERVSARDRLFGETALLDGGTCVATITAVTPLEGLFVERRDFRLLTHAGSEAGRRLDDFLVASVSQWIDRLNALLRETEGPGDLPYTAPAPAADAETRSAAAPAPFDFTRFLPILPLFRTWEPAAIAALAGVCKPLTLRRAEPLFHEGTSAAAAYISVHGALEVTAPTRGAPPRLRRLAVIGPGQLLGYRAIIEALPRKVRVSAREDSLVLQLPAREFRTLWTGETPAGRELREAVRFALLGALQKGLQELARRTHLARLLPAHGMR